MFFFGICSFHFKAHSCLINLRNRCSVLIILAIGRSSSFQKAFLLEHHRAFNSWYFQPQLRQLAMSKFDEADPNWFWNWDSQLAAKSKARETGRVTRVEKSRLVRILQRSSKQTAMHLYAVSVSITYSLQVLTQLYLARLIPFSRNTDTGTDSIDLAVCRALF